MSGVTGSHMGVSRFPWDFELSQPALTMSGCFDLRLFVSARIGDDCLRVF